MISSISVIIACYNGSKYLEDTIKSIVAQNYSQNYIQLVFVDDASTDNSYSLIFDLVEKYQINKFLPLYNKENLGITRTKQHGFEESSGKYIMSLDCDDWISPNYLTEMVKTLQNNSDKDYAYCDTVYHFPDGKEHRFFQPEFNLIRLIENNFISYATLMKRDAFLDTGYDLNNRGHHEDYHLHLRQARKGHFGIHCPLPLFHYRIHDKQSIQSGEVKNNDELFKSYFITQMPELFPENWLPIAKEKLKGLPDNFMSLYGKEFEETLKNKK